MKTSIAKPYYPEFTPITVSVTIESASELAELYAAINAPIHVIKEYERSGFPVPADTTTTELWHKLAKEVDHILLTRKH